MGLARWLIVLLIVAVLALTLTVGGVYFFSWRQAQEDQASHWAAYAKAVAAQIGARAEGTQQLVDALARDPRWETELAGQPWDAIEARLQRMLPDALWVRLLPVGTDVGQGVLSFADLDLAQRAVSAAPPLAMHGLGSPQRHLALARAIRSGDQALAVLLVALDPKWLQRDLTPPPTGAYALMQGKAMLAFRGDAALKGMTPEGRIQVPGTEWEIVYWPVGKDSGPVYALVLWAAAVAVIVLTGYFGWRRISRSLQADVAMLLRFLDDWRLGRRQEFYPLKAKELQPLIDRLLLLSPPVDRAELKEEDEALRREVERKTRTDSGAVKVSADSTGSGDVEVSETTIQVPAKRVFQPCDLRAPLAELPVEVFQALGQAIGTEIQAQGEQAVVVGRDRREGSEALAAALVEGLCASGRDVIDLGAVPAPLVHFGCHYLNVRSGLVVTGGSCPLEYGGLKLTIAGEAWSGKRLLELRQRLAQGRFASGMGQVENRDLLADYIGTVMDDVQLGRPLKVIVDRGVGTVGETVTALLRTLGCEVEEIHSEGLFDPARQDALTALGRRVAADGEAELGLAFDADGDRLAVVDAQGRWVPADRVLMLLAGDVLSREPGSDIVFDTECSRHASRYVVQHGGRPVTALPLPCQLQAKLQETGAALGGSFSGHLWFRERWIGSDDAIYGAARLVEVLSADPLTSDELFAGLPQSVVTPYLETPLESLEETERTLKLLQQTADRFFDDAKVDAGFGVRIDFATGWGAVRAAYARPALQFRFEADDTAALERIQGRFRDWFETLELALPLPFDQGEK
ncbi:phosphomannomutase/phosphoglucomutase [Methylomarinovum tepidoasis]|uniref:phosphomannomutase n=1 Tax=Methylomarinovum tepidoasis TaxID=2840183 RepID=A0AAU9BWB5_9GAMM|nr:phosphomannomutase/phosphoglucomutase [Methylomarinovum sp. IN45]BCX87890.1 phosphomannomutase/phosphoglucomutase [Methylomarinovum sp. IN45]